MNINNSSRLKYEIMTASDSELMYQLDQDTEVMRFINGGKLTSRKEIDEIYLPRMASYTNLKEGWGLWKISLIESSQFIGWVLVRPMDFFYDHQQLDNIELGWRFIRNSWGKGYATEAAMTIKQALVENSQLIDSQQIAKFSAIALEGNNASINIMKKMGMTYLKKDLHKDPLGDQIVVYYQMDVGV